LRGLEIGTGRDRKMWEYLKKGEIGKMKTKEEGLEL
jgi:hypothetical protein